MSKVSKIESIVRNWQDQWSSSPRAESAGLLLADDAPQWDGGRLFGGSSGFFFTETSVTRKQKVKKSIPRCEMNRLSKGYKRAVGKI